VDKSRYSAHIRLHLHASVVPTIVVLIIISIASFGGRIIVLITAEVVVAITRCIALISAEIESAGATHCIFLPRFALGTAIKQLVFA